MCLPSLEKEMATHSSILAQEDPWMRKPGRLQSMGRKELDTTEWLTLHYLAKLIYFLFSPQFQLLASALFKSGSDFTALGKYCSVLYLAVCPRIGEVWFWFLQNETLDEMSSKWNRFQGNMQKFLITGISSQFMDQFAIPVTPIAALLCK